MNFVDELDDATSKMLFANAVGNVVLDFLAMKDLDAAAMVQSAAVTLVTKIKRILDDDTLDDPECIDRIEAIMDAYDEAGLIIYRHDW